MQQQWSGTRASEECVASAEDQREADRRNAPDRRSGLDRRGSGIRQPISSEPRAYGFRDFRERRSMQDRRIWVSSIRPRSGGDNVRRGWSNTAGGELFVRLSREEISVLLGSIDDWSNGSLS